MTPDEIRTLLKVIRQALLLMVDGIEQCLKMPVRTAEIRRIYYQEGGKTSDIEP
jgi:hypothetical protein